MAFFKRTYDWLENKTENFPRFLLILLLIVLLLRLPSLFEPYWHGDEGIYLTLGQAVRRGKTLYADIYDNKPPLLYWLAALSGSQFWFRFLALLFCQAGVVYFYLLADNFLKKKRSLVLATALVALLFCLPLLEGNTANAELFFVPLVLAGVFYFRKNFNWVSGILMSLAFLFKSPPLIEFAALIGFAFLTSSPRSYFDLLKKKIIPLMSGFILPILLVLIYYSFQGAAVQFIKAGFLDNFAYLSSWGEQTGAGGLLALFSSALAQRGLVVAIFAALLFWQTKKGFRPLFFTALWSLAALFASLLSSRPYPHYLLQVVPPLTLTIFLVMETIGHQRKAVLYLLPLVLAFVAIVYHQFYFYPVLPYYKNSFAFVLGRKSVSSYRRWFDTRMDRVYQAAHFLNESTEKNEPVFIWGNEAMIYALARRQPPTRFVVAYHLLSHFSGSDRFAKSLARLKNHPPQVILYDKHFSGSFPGLKSFMTGEYQQIDEFDGLQVWYRFQ